MLKKISSLILPFLGALLILIYIYIRFIRERLPQVIPFNLTEFRFYILLSICLSYMYVIYKYFYPPKTISIFIVKIARLLNFVFIALKSLDSKIKNTKYIREYYNKLFDIQIPYIARWAYKKPGYTYLKIFYIILTLVPNITFLVLLIIDIFFFMKINYFYYFIALGLLPLFHIYFKYSLYNIKEFYILQLEEKYKEVFLMDGTWMEYQWDPDLEKHVWLWTEENATIYHETTMPIRTYIAFHLQLMIQNDVNNTNIKYDLIPFLKKEFYEQHLKDNNIQDVSKISKQDREYLKKTFYDVMPKVLQLDEFLHYYSSITEQEDDYKRIRTFIYVGYLICWAAVLYMSIHTLKDLPLTLKVLESMKNYIITKNPFNE